MVYVAENWHIDPETWLRVDMRIRLDIWRYVNLREEAKDAISGKKPVGDFNDAEEPAADETDDPPPPAGGKILTNR